MIGFEIIFLYFKYFSLCTVCPLSIPVFFNLFVAAEPYTSVKITHGTPCIDL